VRRLNDLLLSMATGANFVAPAEEKPH
jgi:hypothetical protein